MTVYKMSVQYNASVPGPCANYRRVLRIENKVTADAAWQVQVKREQIPQVGNKFSVSKEVLHVSREKVSTEPIHRGTNPLLHRPVPDPDPGRSSRFSFMRTTFSLRTFTKSGRRVPRGVGSRGFGRTPFLVELVTKKILE